MCPQLTALPYLFLMRDEREAPTRARLTPAGHASTPAFIKSVCGVHVIGLDAKLDLYLLWWDPEAWRRSSTSFYSPGADCPYPECRKPLGKSRPHLGAL